MIDTKFFPVHSSIFKYPFKLVHRLTRFKSNGDARIGIVETWKGTSRSERYRSRCNFKFLPFRHTLTSHPLPLISVTVMHAVQPPCSVTFICLSSKLASRRARKFEASNGTAQWGHTTYTWNVSAVIATVITVRQFADHCLCNTSINAASCVHTFSTSLSLSFSLSFSIFLCLSRSHDLSLFVSGDLFETRGKKLNDDSSPLPFQRSQSDEYDNTVALILPSLLSRIFNSEKLYSRRYYLEIFITRIY